MRLYKDGDFVEREAERRSLRDEYRTKFFGGLSVSKTKDPFAYTPDPNAQLETVRTLIEKTISLHGDDFSALQALQSQIGSNALGVPADQLTTGVLGRPAYQDMTVAAFLSRHFVVPGSD